MNTTHQPKFGQQFLPFMAIADFQQGSWQNLEALPFQDLPQSPAWSTVHYGQSAFEGLKAHPSPNGLRLFRPYAHYLRLQATCNRLAMACPPWDLFLQGLRLALREAPVQSAVYLRPLVTSNEAFLGVRPAHQYRFMVMACEALPYFASQGLRLRTETQMARAFPGGTGAVKTPGNYAASLLASSQAKSQGFDDVLWLDAATHASVEEVGAMNVFFRMGEQWLTPELNGSILPGITRDTVLRLMKSLQIPVLEKKITLTELSEGYHQGLPCQAFGTGTAAGLMPIAEIWHEGKPWFARQPGNTQPSDFEAWDRLHLAYQKLMKSESNLGSPAITWDHSLDGWL